VLSCSEDESGNLIEERDLDEVRKVYNLNKALGAATSQDLVQRGCDDSRHK